MYVCKIECTINKLIPNRSKYLRILKFKKIQQKYKTNMKIKKKFQTKNEKSN